MNREIVGKLFPEAIKRMDEGKCSQGDHPTGEFRDELSRKEFEISGMCQSCQDLFFEPETI